MRFTAPQDISAISLSVGTFEVVDGAVDVPDDLGAGDLGGLAVYGFVPAPAVSAKPAPIAQPRASDAGE